MDPVAALDVVALSPQACKPFVPTNNALAKAFFFNAESAGVVVGILVAHAEVVKPGPMEAATTIDSRPEAPSPTLANIDATIGSEAATEIHLGGVPLEVAFDPVIEEIGLPPPPLP